MNGKIAVAQDKAGMLNRIASLLSAARKAKPEPEGHSKADKTAEKSQRRLDRALYGAAESGKCRRITSLVEAGADMSNSVCGQTPLMAAIKRRRENAARLLKTMGASLTVAEQNAVNSELYGVTVRLNSDSTPYDPKCTTESKRREALFLVAVGADPSAIQETCATKRNALMWAVTEGEVELVRAYAKAIVSNGGNINATEPIFGNTALGLARKEAQKGNGSSAPVFDEVAGILQNEFGADPEAKGEAKGLMKI